MASPDTPALMRHATAVVTTTTPESAVAPKAGATPPVDAASVWGRLVSLAPERPHVNLVKSCVTIGRSADCEERIQGNKFISSHHCTISRVDGDAPVLEDKSTNGVLLNGTRVPKGVPQPLKTGDEITLAVSKEDKARYVAYLIKLSDIPPASAATTPSVGDKRKADSDDKAPEHDSIEENLVCPICQCVMHDAVSIVPCLHSFCAGCLSEWMEKSPKKDCPDCRVRVEKIKRNHMLRNLVEAFLKEHPAKRRPADEIAELDAKNKIKEEEFKPKRRRRDYDDDDDDDDDDYSDEDESGSDGSGGFSSTPFMPALRISCASCGSSTASRDGVACTTTAPAAHVRCCCCLNFMPRRDPGIHTTSFLHGLGAPGFGSTFGGAPAASPSVHVSTGCVAAAPAASTTPAAPAASPWAAAATPPPAAAAATTPSAPAATSAPAYPQCCSVCHKAFCNLFWTVGCRCPGQCLFLAEDATIEMHELGRVINGNVHESQILQAHLRTKGISSTDFVRDCLKQLFDKKFSCSLPGYASLGRKSALCKGCLRRVVPELAYQYRAQIARSELPASVTSRGDCWWGKECRTQAHNLTHAQRLNHVCDKSR
eukprot:m.256582 g.256582  ORF g.256582 m.256582 type:complete len:598 (-) comp19172_c2_seq9:100-1893(-)